MSLFRVVRVFGGILLAGGILILLFVAYQLWGTGIITRLHQDQLRTQFNHELAVAHARAHKTHPTTGSPTSTTTTNPDNDTIGPQEPVPGYAPAEGQPIGTINIPKLGINFVVVQGTAASDLSEGPGHYVGTPLPGQAGNAAIAGHRTTYQAPFYNLNEMQLGDPIYVTTLQGRFHYQVISNQVVSPSDVSVLAATPNPELTLTTCNPRFSDTQRLVVQAELVTPPAPSPVLPTHATKTKLNKSKKNVLALSGGLAGEDGSSWGAVAWGAGCAALAAGAWFLIRRIDRRAFRVTLYTTATIGFLVLLFFFFVNLSPLLPASF